MTRETEWHRLRAILIERSYERRHVVLTSGRESFFYIDGKQSSLHPEGAYLLGRLFLERLRFGGPPIEAVGGMTLGADPLVTAVAVVSYLENYPLPAFIIRKEPKGHGTAEWIEGKGNLRLGAKVALLEDVVTTGGTTLKAIERAHEAGVNVTRVLTLVDREEGGRERLEQAGFRLEALYLRSHFETEEFKSAE